MLWLPRGFQIKGWGRTGLEGKEHRVEKVGKGWKEKDKRAEILIKCRKV